MMNAQVIGAPWTAYLKLVRLLEDSIAGAVPMNPEVHWFYAVAVLAALGTALAIHPGVWSGLSYSTGRGERWNPIRWLASGLVHGGFPHLAGNLFLLHTMLPFMKGVVPVSRWALMGICMQLAICCIRSLSKSIFGIGTGFRCIGASGWILAWLGYLAVRNPQSMQLQVLFIFPVPIQEAIFLGFWVSVFCAAAKIWKGLDHEAHAWGLLLGCAWGVMEGTSL